MQEKSKLVFRGYESPTKLFEWSFKPLRGSPSNYITWQMQVSRERSVQHIAWIAEITGIPVFTVAAVFMLKQSNSTPFTTTSIFWLYAGTEMICEIPERVWESKAESISVAKRFSLL